MGSTEGTFDEAKGRAKQAAGDLTDDENLRSEGKADEIGGKAKGKMGELKDKVDGAVDAVKGKLRRD